MNSTIGTTGAQASAVTGGSIDAALSVTVLTVFSKEILMRAMPKFRLMQFARMKTELGVNKGDKITMFRYNPIRKGKKLTEGVPIDPKTLDATTQDLTVAEFGNKVKLTERLLRTSAFAQLLIAAKQLGDDYAFTTEVDLLLTLESLPSTLYANEKASRGALGSSDKLSSQTVRAAVEIMKTKSVPMIQLLDPMSGGVEEVYVMFVSPHQARNLREDSAWINAALYAGSRRIFQGEIGMYEKVIFIETTMQPIIKSTASGLAGHYFINNEDLSDSDLVDDPITPDAAPHATVDIHVAYMIGDYCYGFAEALPVEMRDEPPEDLGRIRKLGWYSIQGSGLINADHGLRIETA